VATVVRKVFETSGRAGDQGELGRGRHFEEDPDGGGSGAGHL
jgi:hypothetical protein